MQNSQQLKSLIVDYSDQLDAIIKVAEREDRDLSAEECKATDDIVTDKLPRLRSQLAAVEQVESERNSRLAPEFLERLSQKQRLEGTPEAIGRFGSYGTVGGQGWTRDSKGRSYSVLAKGDSATKLEGLRPVCENQFGHFVCAKLFGANRNTPGEVRAALSGNDNSLGGFLVPERLSAEIIDLARARSVLMEAGTRTVVMDSDNLTIPKLETDVVPETKTQNSAFTATDMVFGARKLNTYTAGVFTKMSRELYEDAPDMVAQQLEQFMAAKLATQVDLWGLNGSGSAEPLGILGRGIDDTDSIGQPDWLDLSAAATDVRVANHEPSSVIMHPSVYAALAELETGDGTNAARGWLSSPPNLSQMAFLQSTNMPLTKMILGDFTRYLMGVRTGAQVEATSQAGDAFERHQVWVKITMRFDYITLDDTAFHTMSGVTLA